VVSDVSAIGADVWAVVGTRPISSLSAADAYPATVEVSMNDGVTWTTTGSDPPVLEEPGISVADQDLELARITPSRAYALSFAPAPTSGGATLGRLGYTADGGQTWVERPDPCPRYFDVGQEIAASGTDDLWMVCASEPSGGSQAKALYRSSDGGQHWTLAAAANAPVLSGNVSLPAGGRLPVGGYVSPDSLGHENLAVLTPQAAWLFPDRSGVFQTTNGATLVVRRVRPGPQPGSSVGERQHRLRRRRSRLGVRGWAPVCGGRTTACTGSTSDVEATMGRSLTGTVSTRYRDAHATSPRR
jgi:hypothetical protein